MKRLDGCCNKELAALSGAANRRLSMLLTLLPVPQLFIKWREREPGQSLQPPPVVINFAATKAAVVASSPGPSSSAFPAHKPCAEAAEPGTVLIQHHLPHVAESNLLRSRASHAQSAPAWLLGAPTRPCLTSTQHLDTMRTTSSQSPLATDRTSSTCHPHKSR